MEEAKKSPVYKALSPDEQEEWLQRIEDDFTATESTLWGHAAKRRPSNVVKDTEARMRIHQSLAESKQKMHSEVDDSNLSAATKTNRHREIDAYYSQVMTTLREME
jgi:hypothetical protein